MPEYSFTFGPDGTYFLNTPLRCKSSGGLPQGLKDAIYTDVQASQRCVGIGSDGAYFYARHTPRGDLWNFQPSTSGSADKDVTKWLNEQTRAGCGKIQVSYGPKNTWVACTALGAAYWSTDSVVSEQIRGFHPVKATLGVDNAYVLVDQNNRVKWNLKGRYDLLDQILRNSNLAIECVALNPHAAGQYIIIFQNGSYRGHLPTSYNQEVCAAIDEAVAHQADINMQTAKIVSNGLMEQQKIMNNFFMNMSNSMWQ